MSRDVLLYGLSNSETYARLMAWAQAMPYMADVTPDYHRLQLEHWIWSHRARLTGRRVLDVGVYHAKRWIGDGYLTVGEYDEDVRADLLALPFEPAAFDAVLLTEVLEHCIDPRAAVAEVWRVLRPGGLLLVTSPFFWPDHRTDQYADYWRFTEQGWRLLLAPFVGVEIASCEWTPEGAAGYEQMRRFECQGFADQTQATTAYLCEASKP